LYNYVARAFRFIALADDNFYPVTLTDLQLAERQNNHTKLNELRSIRKERFELMARLAELPADMVFYTQITMEAAEIQSSWKPCGRPTSKAHWWAWKP